MNSYAQTNIQLYGQLLVQNWPDADLRVVHAAHELAMRVFAGHHRPNHKTFVAHLVGTASILAAHGAESSVVAAGLLHSAYSHGEFGDGSRGMTASKRQTVRRAIGELSESLIARYTVRRWTLAELHALTVGPYRLPALERAVAFIKLADVREDHLDCGMQYSPNKQLPGGDDANNTWRDSLVDVATALGHDSLAAELQIALGPTQERPLPDFLLGQKSASYVLPPISHGMRTTVWLAKLLRRWRRKLTRPLKRAVAEAA